MKIIIQLPKIIQVTETVHFIQRIRFYETLSKYYVAQNAQHVYDHVRIMFIL